MKSRVSSVARVTGFGSHSFSCSVDSGDLRRCKAAKMLNRSPPSSGKVKNERSFTSSPPYAFVPLTYMYECIHSEWSYSPVFQYAFLACARTFFHILKVHVTAALNIAEWSAPSVAMQQRCRPLYGEQSGTRKYSPCCVWKLALKQLSV